MQFTPFDKTLLIDLFIDEFMSNSREANPNAEFIKLIAKIGTKWR